MSSSCCHFGHNRGEDNTTHDQIIKISAIYNNNISYLSLLLILPNKTCCGKTTPTDDDQRASSRRGVTLKLNLEIPFFVLRFFRLYLLVLFGTTDALVWQEGTRSSSVDRHCYFILFSLILIILALL